MSDNTPGTATICHSHAQTLLEHGERLENHDARLGALEVSNRDERADREEMKRMLHKLEQTLALSNQRNDTRWGNALWLLGVVVTALVGTLIAGFASVVNALHAAPR